MLAFAQIRSDLKWADVLRCLFLPVLFRNSLFKPMNRASCVPPRVVSFDANDRVFFAAKLSSQDREDLVKELHVFAAGMKPACTWHKNKALQTARECCGGMVRPSFACLIVVRLCVRSFVCLLGLQ